MRSGPWRPRRGRPWARRHSWTSCSAPKARLCWSSTASCTDLAAAARSGARPFPRALVIAASGLVAYFVVTLGALPFLLSPRDLATHLFSPPALRALWLTLETTAIATILAVALGTP